MPRVAEAADRAVDMRLQHDGHRHAAAERQRPDRVSQQLAATAALRRAGAAVRAATRQPGSHTPCSTPDAPTYHASGARTTGPTSSRWCKRQDGNQPRPVFAREQQPQQRQAGNVESRWRVSRCTACAARSRHRLAARARRARSGAPRAAGRRRTAPRAGGQDDQQQPGAAGATRAIPDHSRARGPLRAQFVMIRSPRDGSKQSMNILDTRLDAAVEAASPERGFTLIEIMVVVIIIGLLAALVVPQFRRVDDARITKAKDDIQALETALTLYKLDNFNYPTTEEGLAGLVEQPSDRSATGAGRLPRGSTRTRGATTTSTSIRARTAVSMTSIPWVPTASRMARSSTPTLATGTWKVAAAGAPPATRRRIHADRGAGGRRDHRHRGAVAMVSRRRTRGRPRGGPGNEPAFGAVLHAGTRGREAQRAATSVFGSTPSATISCASTRRTCAGGSRPTTCCCPPASCPKV